MPALQTYSGLRKGGSPNSLVVDAVSQLEPRSGSALDAGAGPLNDTRFLLRAGLSVLAVDTDIQTASLAAGIDDSRLSLIQGDIRDVAIAAGAYVLVVAIHVLPFLPREDVPAVLASLIGGVSNGGLLCCTFLGPDDSWARTRPQMTFVSRASVTAMLSGLEAIELSERKYDGHNARGEPKRWHVVRCICRKR